MSFPNHRGRRLRSNQPFIDSLAETSISAKNLVMPYFIQETNKDLQIKSMSGMARFTEKGIMEEVSVLQDLNINMVALFPVIPNEKKTPHAKESLNSNNLICRVLRKLKKKFPKLIIICDVALDAYTLSGHDGILNNKNEIDNDKTIKILSNMAVNFAKNGCDILAPSDMMDGRVKLIREELEKKGLVNKCILSYSSKFSSNLYTPFRDALGSSKNLGNSNKSSYQIDFRNRREAIKESLEDIEEGADIIMVKPAGYYLDIVREIKNQTLVPIAAYQVSGEYSMIKYLSDKQFFNYRDLVLESLYCIKRAGADIIFTYFAKEVAKWLK